ncbi:NAD/NADP octopine/nopaline dehydrogenase family protein [Bacteroidota bacterium]
MRIAVIGSGNGGCAVAADCALHGNDVRLFDFAHFSQNIDAIKKAKGIRSSGVIEGFAPITYAGHDITGAVSDAELIYVVGPSYATVPFAREYKKVMKKGQKVIVCPGTNGGALIFKKELGLDYSDTTIVVSETSTLPYACRILNPGEVHIYHKLKAGLFIASLPSSEIDTVFQPFKQVYSGSKPYKNVLQTLLQNGNNVIHPAVSLLNVGRIESPQDFFFYEEGITPAVGKLMEAVDKERLAIANAFGLEILSEPETGFIQGYMLEKNYDSGYNKAPGFVGIKAQTQIDYRYFTEDVGYGLVLLAELAKSVGVNTPVINAIIELVSVILETDYNKNAYRTLDDLGISGLSINEMIEAVK